MRGIQGPKTGRREDVCPRSNGRGDGNVPDCSVCPLGNFDTPIHQGMLRILKREDIRSYQAVNTVRDALEDGKHCSGFLRNPCLVLIIKRPIETVEIEI